MIAEIVKGSSCKNFIEYNEYKVEKGEAVRISSTAQGRDAKELKMSLDLTVQTNARLKKNKFQHVVVSFHKDDDIESEKFLDVWEQYQAEMGYADTCNVIYEHNDTHLRHYHIVMSTVDFAGNKINDYNDYLNNRDVCRKLEADFGLYQIIYEDYEKQRINSQNANKFSIYNLLRSRVNLKKERLSIGNTFTSTVLKYKMSNQQVKENFISPGETTYEDLLEVSRKYSKTHKQELIEQLLDIRKSSDDYQQFFKAVKDQNFYIRRLKRNDGTSNMVYGNPETNTYIKNSQLPKQLRYDYLFSDTLEFNLDDQSKFLRNIAIKSSKKAVSWDDYLKILSSYNIEIKTQENKNGIYAYALKSANIKNGEFIKASAIHNSLSIGKLSKHLKPVSIKKLTKKEIVTEPKEIKKALSKGKETSRLLHDESEVIKDQIRKQKLKNQEQKERGEGPQ